MFFLDCVRRGCFLQTIRGQVQSLRISFHQSFSKVVDWTMFLESYLHEVIDIGEVFEGLHPTLMAIITISHPPSAQASFRLGRLHQRLLDTDSMPGARPLMAMVTDNVVLIGSNIFQSVLVTG